MDRLTGRDTGADIVRKMSKMADGFYNPGASSVLIDLLALPASDGIPAILNLDTLRLYGSDIWVAYKDVCGQDVNVLAQRLREDPHNLRTEVEASR